MNAEPYDNLPGEVSQKVSELVAGPDVVVATAKVRDILYAKLNERMTQLAESGELSRLSDEECQLLAEFRRFKATTKPGGVFRWQTRADVELGVVVATDTGLVRHPQNVSE